MTPVAARVGGTVLRVPVADNQPVEAGTVLVEIDPRDYQIALDRARAELANAEAEAAAANAERADHGHVDEQRRGARRRAASNKPQAVRRRGAAQPRRWPRRA